MPHRWLDLRKPKPSEWPDRLSGWTLPPLSARAVGEVELVRVFESAEAALAFLWSSKENASFAGRYVSRFFAACSIVYLILLGATLASADPLQSALRDLSDRDGRPNATGKSRYFHFDQVPDEIEHSLLVPERRCSADFSIDSFVLPERDSHRAVLWTWGIGSDNSQRDRLVQRIGLSNPRPQMKCRNIVLEAHEDGFKRGLPFIFASKHKGRISALNRANDLRHLWRDYGFELCHSSIEVTSIGDTFRGNVGNGKIYTRNRQNTGLSVHDVFGDSNLADGPAVVLITPGEFTVGP
jgi:hypothetical protein